MSDRRLAAGECPCVKAERPVAPCVDCWHFGNGKPRCRHCGQPPGGDLSVPAHLLISEPAGYNYAAAKIDLDTFAPKRPPR